MSARGTNPATRPRERIEWPEILRRVEAAQAAVERALAPTAEEMEKVLAARAKLLAREPEGQGSSQGSIEVIEFLLAYEHYALESAFVREVVALKELTPLPGAPPFVLGLANVRGTIFSVVDLKKFFGLPDKGLTDLNKLVIVSQDDLELGVLADVLLGVRSIPLDQVNPPPSTFTGLSAKYLRGVTAERLIVLDVDHILSDESLTVHETSGQPAERKTI